MKQLRKKLLSLATVLLGSLLMYSFFVLPIQNLQVNPEIDISEITQEEIESSLYHHSLEEFSVSFDYPISWEMQEQESSSTVHLIIFNSLLDPEKKLELTIISRDDFEISDDLSCRDFSVLGCNPRSEDPPSIQFPDPEIDNGAVFVTRSDDWVYFVRFLRKHMADPDVNLFLSSFDVS